MVYLHSAPLRRLGDWQGALQNVRQSLAIIEPMAAKNPANADLQNDLRATFISLAEALLAASDHDGALEHYRRALAIAETAAAAHPTDLYARWRLADVYSGLGQYYATLAVHPGGAAARLTAGAKRAFG